MREQTTNRLRGWEGWNNDSIELHLQTRFAQLEVAAHLELWTEGFRTVEDIYNIMQVNYAPSSKYASVIPLMMKGIGQN